MGRNGAEARLDVAVTTPGGTTNFLDVAIVDSYSDSVGIELQRAKHPGAAAAAMERHKRTKYGADARLVPFVIESHGRLGAAATRWLCRAYAGHADEKRALLQELSALVQAHTASMLLASAG